MSTPVVAIVGRPNVGKSSLFNRLLGKSTKAITYDLPGVTRDRHYGVTKWEKPVILVDTGGFYPDGMDVPETHQKMSAFHRSCWKEFFKFTVDTVKVAIDQADLVLMVVDVREGVLPLDETILHYLRKSRTPFYLVVNKCDRGNIGAEFDFFSLGVSQKQIFPVSAAHGLGAIGLQEKIEEHFENCEIAPSILEDIIPREDLLGSVSIIGAPNAGKSTLLNKLLGRERSLVTPIPGTTIDPVDGHVEVKVDDEESHWIRLIDTAGIRRKSQVKEVVESQSVFRSLRSITDSDAVIFVIDSLMGMTHQDRRLCDVAIEKGKSIVVALSKSDLVESKYKNPESSSYWPKVLKDNVAWLQFADVKLISANTGEGIKELEQTVVRTLQMRNKKISPNRIVRCLHDLMDGHPLSLKFTGGRPLKVRYAVLVKSDPPTFLIFANRVKNIPKNYRTYLVKGLRERFGLWNTPLHLIFRSGSQSSVPKKFSGAQESCELQEEEL